MSSNAHFWVVLEILTSKVGETDLVFGLSSEFTDRSVHTRLQLLECGSYDLCHWLIWTHRQTDSQHSDH